MPTYGYHCNRCQAEFEVFQRMTDDPVAECPSCGSPGRRLFYPAGIVFKGSGFYKTDSRARSTTPSGGDSKKAGSDTAPAAASKDSAGGGSTPATGAAEKKTAASPAPAAEK